MTEGILAWHFLPNDGLTQHSRMKVEVGQTLIEKRPLMLCAVGLHGSRRAIDALYYAPGSLACRVRLSGEVVEGDDKLCASHRTCLSLGEASEVLNEFSCRCAERALLHERKFGRDPNPHSWAAIDAKRAWLRGEIDDTQLDAAEAAARGGEATYRLAVAKLLLFPCWAQFRKAAWDAEREWQNTELESMLNDLLGCSSVESRES